MSDNPIQHAESVVGFTGTRHGMTEAQKGAVSVLLHELEATHVVHGDCVGADAEFHKIAKEQGLWVAVNPPTDDRLRAYCEGDLVLEPLGYLTRNKAIVGGSDLLIAAPREMTEQDRGGTWYTVRYARTKRRRVIVVWPDGRTHIDGPVEP
jgi:hypothetical protein